MNNTILLFKGWHPYSMILQALNLFHSFG